MIELCELFAKIVGNDQPIWTCFPPQVDFAITFQQVMMELFVPKKLNLMTKNPKHSLGFIVNLINQNPKALLKELGGLNEDIGGSQVLFCEGDGLGVAGAHKVVRETITPSNIFNLFAEKSLHHYWLLAECIFRKSSRVAKQISDLLIDASEVWS